MKNGVYHFVKLKEFNLSDKDLIASITFSVCFYDAFLELETY